MACLVAMTRRATLAAAMACVLSAGPASAAPGRPAARPARPAAAPLPSARASGWKASAARTLSGPASGRMQRYLGEARRRFDGPNTLRFRYHHPGLSRMFQQQDRLRAGQSVDGRSMNGLLPTTGYWNYLRWRRSLNPARFDHYHPRTGPMLALDRQIRERAPLPPPTPTDRLPQALLEPSRSPQVAALPSPDPEAPGVPSPTYPLFSPPPAPAIPPFVPPPGVPSTEPPLVIIPPIPEPPGPPDFPGPPIGVVPEPGAATLLGVGAAVAALVRRRSRRRASA